VQACRHKAGSLVTGLHGPARKDSHFSCAVQVFCRIKVCQRSLFQNSGLTSANSEGYSIDHLSEEPGAGAEVKTSVAGARQTVAQAWTERHVSLSEQMLDQIITES
jgi:hypothetical protein